MSIEAVGWLGSILFSICGLPQLVKTWKTKKVDDLSSLFLWLWFWGEILTFCYIVAGDVFVKSYHIPLYFNYAVNILIVIYLLYAKYAYKVVVIEK
ncbi:MAG TPA: PQ-loop repeat-containing protein [Williamwhitmania sp.]|nr:PQ-loop repeat-containing protein [Williamwhitmania sp.]